ncbi:MAG: hypothetical protein HRU34_08830 [Richelia sp.]|nr:hypothetical protein [Richelia sp.]CDN11262.1 hypothetical protein RintRC_5317 [Richelia intracellularis]
MVSNANSSRTYATPDLNMQVTDPFIHQIILTLQLELRENQTIRSLYADSLGHTLGLHLLKRYAKLDDAITANVGYNHDLI